MEDRRNIIKWILIIVILILLIFLGLRIFKKDKKAATVFTEISLEKYEKLLDSKEQVMIYISSKKDSSKDYEENLVTVLDEDEKSMYYLDLSKLKGEDIVTFMNADELTSDDYVEPMILVIKDSRIKDKVIGVVSKTELVRFLDKYKN